MLDLRWVRLDRRREYIVRDVTEFAAHPVGRIASHGTGIEERIVGTGEQDEPTGAAHEELLAVDRVRHDLAWSAAELGRAKNNKSISVWTSLISKIIDDARPTHTHIPERSRRRLGPPKR